MLFFKCMWGGYGMDPKTTWIQAHTNLVSEITETHGCITFESHSSVGILNNILPKTNMEF